MFNFTKKRLEYVRQAGLYSWQKAKLDSGISQIISAVGELPVDFVPHKFKSASFTFPVQCDFCNQTIWGISKVGLTCKTCAYNCHAKCKMKARPKCSAVKSVAIVNRRASYPAGASGSAWHAQDKKIVKERVDDHHQSSILPEPTKHDPTVSAASAHELDGSQECKAVFDYNATEPEELSIKIGELLFSARGCTPT